MKKGFTLAEVLIVVAIIATIMTVTLPIINRARPDENAIKYRNAFYGFERAIGNLTNSITKYPEGDLAKPLTNCSAESEVYTLNFCNDLMGEFSSIDTACVDSKPDTAARSYYTFTTSNNMVFYVPLITVEGLCSTTPARNDQRGWTHLTGVSSGDIIVCVDVNGAGNDTENLPNTGCSRNADEPSKDQFRINLNQMGKVSTTTDWSIENEILQRSAKVRKN